MSDAEVRVVFSGDSGAAQRAVRGLDGSFGGLGRTLGGIGKAMGAVGIAGGVLVGVLGVKAVKAAADFDKSMRAVNTITKLNEKQFDDLGKRVLEVSKKVGKAPTELAAGLYDVVSSGFKANDALKVLTVSAKAAVAGQTSTATATKAVVAVLNAYKLPASEAANVSDQLFKTVEKGVLTFEELAANVGDFVGIASNLNVPLSEVGAMLATITTNGVPAAQAATQVKNLFTSMLNPSTALKDQLKGMGYESGAAAIKQKGLAGVVRELWAASKGNLATLAEWIPNQEALGAIINSSGKKAKDFAQFTKDIAGASGSANKAYEEMGKSFSVRWDKIKARITATAIPIGEALIGPLEGALGVLQQFIGWLDKLGAAKTWKARLSIVIDGVGDLAGGIADKIKEILFGKDVQVPVKPKLTPGATADGISEMIGDVPLKFTWEKGATKGPMQEGAGDIPTETVHQPGILDEILGQTKAEDIKGVLQSIADAVAAVADAISGHSGEISSAFGAIGDRAGEAADAVKEGFGENLKTWAERELRPAFENIKAWTLAGIADPTVRTVAASVWGAVRGSISGATFGIKSSVEVFARTISGDFKGALESVAKAGAAIVLTVAPYVRSALEITGAVAGRAWDVIGPPLRSALGKVGSAASAAISGATQIGKTISTYVLSGAMGAWNMVPSGLRGVITSLAGAVGSAVTSAASIGKNIVTAIVSGLAGLGGQLVAKIWAELRGISPISFKLPIHFSLPSLPSIPHPFARGGKIDEPMIMAGEEAPGHPEWMISTNPRDRSSNVGYWMAAGKALGIPGFKKGGPIGESSSAAPARPLAAIVGDAARAITSVENASKRVSDAGKEFDLYGRNADLTSETLLTDLEGGGAARNEVDIARRLAELDELLRLKQGVIDALMEQIDRIQKAVETLERLIGELQNKISGGESTAMNQEDSRKEHAKAARDADREAKRLRGKKGATDADRKAADAKEAESAREEKAARAAKAARDDTLDAIKDWRGKIVDFRQSITDLGGQRHDLEFDVRGERISLQGLQNERSEVAATTGREGTAAPDSAAATSTTTTTSTSADTSELDRLRAMVAKLNLALGIQGAQLGVIGSFDKGTINVPYTGLAMVHAGERITPASIPQAGTNGDSGGGTVVEIHGDAAMLADFFKVKIREQTGAISDRIGREADRSYRSGLARAR